MAEKAAEFRPNNAQSYEDEYQGAQIPIKYMGRYKAEAAYSRENPTAIHLIRETIELINRYLQAARLSFQLRPE